MAHDTEAARRTKVEGAIAAIKFKQSLKKEEHDTGCPAVSAEDSTQFCADLDATLQRNTPVNVQKCTTWISKHIAPSKARTVLLGDYLVSVSKSIVVDQQATAAPIAETIAETTAEILARSRFHLLLIVNDVLHTDKFHSRNGAKQGTFSDAANPSILELIDLAASTATQKDSLIEQRLRALLNYWAVNQLIGAEVLKPLQDRADDALLLAQGGTPIRRRNYLLPEYHGDRSAPWYELPASYMLDQMIRHPQRPIDPSRIRIAKLDKKPASPHVRKLLDNYFENVDLIYHPTGDNPTGETEMYKLSLDPMGHVVKTNKESGESAVIYNGYGWSVKFCQDMQTHGMPESIKIAREDAMRMDDIEKARKSPVRRHDERRGSRSHRRRGQSSSESEYRREPGRQGRRRSHGRGLRQSSSSSYDSRDSRSRSRHRSHGRQDRPSRGNASLNNRGRGYNDSTPLQARQPPNSYGRGFVQPESQWNGSNGGNSNGTQQHSSSQPTHSNSRGSAQVPHTPFSVPPYPLQPLEQFPGSLPLGQFPLPPPPPPLGGVPVGMGLPFPPPPNLAGHYPPAGPPMGTMENTSYNYGNQYGNQQGQNVAYSQGSGYGQHQADSNARGGRGGRYSGNRGGYGGYQRGQRGGRY